MSFAIKDTGENLIPAITFIKNSRKKKETTILRGRKFWVKKALAKAKIPNASMIPAPARTTRSLSTGYGAGFPSIVRLGITFP